MKYLDYHECAPYCLAKLPEDFRKQVVNDLAIREEIAKTSSVSGAYVRRRFWEDHALWTVRVGSALYDGRFIGPIEWQWVKAYASCYYALYARWHGRQDQELRWESQWPVKSDWRGWLKVLWTRRKPLVRKVINTDPFVEVRAEIAQVEKTIAKWAVPPREKVE